jgi:hypothetical protein
LELLAVLDEACLRVRVEILVVVVERLVMAFAI